MIDPVETVPLLLRPGGEVGPTRGTKGGVSRDRGLREVRSVAGGEAEGRCASGGRSVKAVALGRPRLVLLGVVRVRE